MIFLSYTRPEWVKYSSNSELKITIDIEDEVIFDHKSKYMETPISLSAAILMEDTLPTIRKYPSYSAPLWWKESYGPWDLVKRFRVAITKLDEDLFYVQNGEKGRAKSNIVFAWEVLHEIPKNE